MIARALAAFALVAGCIDEPPRAQCAPPRELAEVNHHDAQEFSPYLSRDRLELYFASDRDGLYNIYRSTRSSVDALFSAGQPVITAGNVFDPVLSADGNTMWFVNGDGDTNGMIMSAHRDRSGFTVDQQVFANLGSVLHPTLTADGLWIYYAVSQTDVATSHDLYRAHRTSVSDDFGDIEALPVNTPYDEQGPTISADGSTLLYVTNVVPDGPLGDHVMQVSTSDFSSPQLVTGLNPGDGTNEQLGALHPDNRTIVYVTAAASPSNDVWIYCE